jgi:predicted RNA-binding protein YlqC (UPF0109 family)
MIEQGPQAIRMNSIGGGSVVTSMMDCSQEQVGRMIGTKGSQEQVGRMIGTKGATIKELHSMCRVESLFNALDTTIGTTVKEAKGWSGSRPCWLIATMCAAEDDIMWTSRRRRTMAVNTAKSPRAPPRGRGEIVTKVTSARVQQVAQTATHSARASLLKSTRPRLPPKG